MRAEPSEHATKTYRYLRLAMVTLIVMLAASVGIEWWQAGRDCFQTSISGYYYTPVRAILVGTLISIGVCMVALKGNTEWEDILLNGAGMLAPVAGLVAIPAGGTCRSVPLTFRDSSADIANNMAALFLAGGLALAITIGIALKDPRGGTASAATRRPWERPQLLGMVVAALVLGAAVAWFSSNRAGFMAGAHYTAAAAMFGCIIGVVILNAKGLGRRRRSAIRSRAPYANRYTVIAAGMVVVPVSFTLWKWLVGWEHAILWIEGVLIVLFAIFWLIQTEELWHEGLRQQR
jgi:hypothetical protein